MGHDPHHARGHGPHHGHAGEGSERRVAIAFAITASFAAIEAAGGVFSGSLALLADAGHMLVDCLALGLAWAGIRIARRPADPRRSYGYRRVEVLAAWINGVVLCGVVLWVAVEAVSRMLDPVAILPLPMLAVAIAGLGANVAAYAVLRGGRARLNVRAAMLHVLGDILGSIAVIVGAGVIMLTGWVAIDPILSLAVAALIVPSAIAIVRQSTHILLEGTPAEIDPAALGADLSEAVAEVAEVHHVHAWSLTDSDSLVTLHARLNAGAEPGPALAAIKARLAARFAITHSVVQIEAGPCPDSEPASQNNRPGLRTGGVAQSA